MIAIFGGLFVLIMAWASMGDRGAAPGVGPQDLLTQWVLGCLFVGAVLLVGGARAAGAALVGSSSCSSLAYFLKGLYGGDHLETLVHGAVILGSVGLVVFGLAGLALGTHRPLGRYPTALVLAFGTVVVGALLNLRIQTDGWGPQNQANPAHGFEDPWVQPLLAFNVAFLAALFLVQAWRASRSSGEHGDEEDEDDPFVDWLVRPSRAWWAVLMDARTSSRDQGEQRAIRVATA